jgi:protein TonB
MTGDGHHLLKAGWGISLSLHVLVLFGASLWIVRHPVFGVQAGPISAEVDLVAAAPTAADLEPPIPDSEGEEPKKQVAPPPPSPAHPQPKKAEAAKETARSSQGTTQATPDYLNNPPPVYPEAARHARQQGTAFFSLLVSDDGKVLRVELSRSTGYPLLDAAAAKAVKAWKFRPASVGGVAVSSQVSVPVRFLLQ